MLSWFGNFNQHKIPHVDIFSSLTHNSQKLESNVFLHELTGFQSSHHGISILWRIVLDGKNNTWSQQTVETPTAGFLFVCLKETWMKWLHAVSYQLGKKNIPEGKTLNTMRLNHHLGQGKDNWRSNLIYENKRPFYAVL